jgi:hypothetical protein
MKVLEFFGVRYFAKSVYAWLRGLAPDHLVARIDYFRINGRFPNLKTPRSLNEKIIWLKLNDRRRWHSNLADKLAVKAIVDSVVGYSVSVPTLACFDDINQARVGVNQLLRPFIIKPTHDSGGGYIVRGAADLAKINWMDLRFRLSRNYYHYSKEFQYNSIPRRLIVEPLLTSDDDRIPNDYKFHVLNGRVIFIYCSIDREGENYRKIYNREWVNEGVTWAHPKDLEKKFDGPDIPKPAGFNQMVAIAEKLIFGFCYLRIDFYEVNGRIYVGEITQHQSGGNCPISPFVADLEYGERLKLYLSPESLNA